jgi:hypothetical protein
MIESTFGIIELAFLAFQYRPTINAVWPKMEFPFDFGIARAFLDFLRSTLLFHTIKVRKSTGGVKRSTYPADPIQSQQCDANRFDSPNHVVGLSVGCCSWNIE